MNLASRAIRKAARASKITLRKRRLRKFGLAFFPPNYLYLQDRLDASSIVLDVGCADDPDLSRHLLDRYSCHCYGVDPTHKHAPALRAMEQEFPGRFTYVTVAVGPENGTITFNESVENASGSILTSHRNVLHDTIRSYEVECVTLPGLLEKIGLSSADYIKLDLEGAEYDLLERSAPEDLSPFRQMFIEFHHRSFDRYSPRDTAAMAENVAAAGFSCFSLDDHNYLFYR